MAHEPYYAWGLAQLGHIAVAQGENGGEKARWYYGQGLALAVKHRQAPTALNIFGGVAGLLAPAGDVERATELLALVIGHAAGTFETKEKARKLLADVKHDISAEVSVMSCR